VFHLAQQILVRREQQAIDHLRELLAAGTLTNSDVATWPLFDRLRDEGNLDDVLI